MDILICLIENQQIGLELKKINSVIFAVETISIPHADSHFLGAINVHGTITLVLNMRKLLGLPIKELEANDQFILYDIHQKQMALWVDHVKRVKFYENEELIPAAEFLTHLPGLQYGIKEDNQIILIYDLEKLLPSSLLNKQLKVGHK